MANEEIYEKVCKAIIFEPLKTRIDKDQDFVNTLENDKQKTIDFDLATYLYKIRKQLFNQLPGYKEALNAIDLLNDPATSQNKASKKAINNQIDSNVKHNIGRFMQDLYNSGDYNILSYEIVDHFLVIKIQRQTKAMLKTLFALQRRFKDEGIKSNLDESGTLYVTLMSDKDGDKDNIIEITQLKNDKVSVCFGQDVDNYNIDAEAMIAFTQGKIRSLIKILQIVRPYMARSM